MIAPNKVQSGLVARIGETMVIGKLRKAKYDKAQETVTSMLFRNIRKCSCHDIGGMYNIFPSNKAGLNLLININGVKKSVPVSVTKNKVGNTALLFNATFFRTSYTPRKKAETRAKTNQSINQVFKGAKVDFLKRMTPCFLSFILIINHVQLLRIDAS